MKKQKQSSRRRVSHVEFARRSGVLENLRNRFPSQMDEMIALLVRANNDFNDHIHEFAFDLSGILHIHRRRLNSLFQAAGRLEYAP